MEFSLSFFFSQLKRSIGVFFRTIKAFFTRKLMGVTTALRRLTNFSRNATRRADISVGISYGDNLPAALKALEAMMQKNELILKDPAPQVLVANFAESSVTLTLRFWTSGDKYWDAYWMVKEQLKGAIEEAGLNIPFPQRVVTLINKAEK